MKKQILLIAYLCMTSILFSQVGIGSENPQNTLEIKSQSNSSATNALEVNNSNNEPVSVLKDNGNFIFHGALMPNGDPGEVGSYLVSEGVNTAPVWKKFKGPEGTKLITQVFNARRNSYSSTRRSANQTYRIDFPTVQLSAPSNIGSWNSSNNEFTVTKSGLYHITSGFTAENITYNPPTYYLQNEDGIMWINTTRYTQGVKGQGIQLTPSTNGMSFSNEIVVPLYAGDKIWITSRIRLAWNQSTSFIHIKYSEL